MGADVSKTTGLVVGSNGKEIDSPDDTAVVSAAGAEDSTETAAGAVRVERGLPLGLDPSAPVARRFVFAARGIASPNN